jgi:hypothetical protein
MKGILQIRSVRNIKSIHSAGARSIPKVQRSSHLDLYMLGRERDRLEKEIFALDKRRSTAQSKLDLINQRLEKLQKETHEAQKIRTHRSAPTRPVKTMTLNY